MLIPTTDIVWWWGFIIFWIVVKIRCVKVSGNPGKYGRSKSSLLQSFPIESIKPFVFLYISRPSFLNSYSFGRVVFTKTFDQVFCSFSTRKQIGRERNCVNSFQNDIISLQ